MKTILFLFILLSLHFTGLCQNLMPQEGYINVIGGRIWYKVVGEDSGIPLLIIHGGPGGRSCISISAYSALGDERPIIFPLSLVFRQGNWLLIWLPIGLEGKYAFFYFFWNGEGAAGVVVVHDLDSFPSGD